MLDYPDEWNELPKHERKKKVKALRSEQEKKAAFLKAIRSWSLVTVIVAAAVIGYMQLIKKSPEEIEFEQQVAVASLDGKVEEFPVEGRDHVPAGTTVEYQTNPPTSGGHLGQAKEWGIYSQEIDDKAGVHNLEHGGIWITYTDISEEEIETLEALGKQNSQSTVVSPRSGNDSKIAVASWGKVLRLESVDIVLIQKYIDTYKNQSPERLAR